MDQNNTALIITHTKNWITDIVVGCNFCPFAARELKRDSIHYEVLPGADAEATMAAVTLLVQQLDTDKNIETAFLILPDNFDSFEEYLDLLESAEALNTKNGYEGVYQIASFHPKYVFAGSNEMDASNYTNRSPYPMLHFLREESVSKAIDSYPGIDEVPFSNIAFAKEKGLEYMRQLLMSVVEKNKIG